MHKTNSKLRTLNPCTVTALTTCSYGAVRIAFYHSANRPKGTRIRLEPYSLFYYLRNMTRSSRSVTCTRTVIPSTNSKSGAVILTQNRLSANSKNDSKLKATKELSTNKPSATKKPRTIFKFRAVMLSTIQRPRAINSNSNAKRIDLKQDLQITSSSNK